MYISTLTQLPARADSRRPNGGFGHGIHAKM